MKALIAALVVALTLGGSTASAADIPPTSVAIVNQTTQLTDAQVAALLPYLQIYADQVCSHWGCNVVLVRARTPVTGQWRIYLQDGIDVNFAYGYHGSHRGTPFAKIDAWLCHINQLSITSVISHELAEMLADPETGRFFQISKTVFVIAEVADPVDHYRFKLGPYPMSDYVFPAWFDRGAKGPYDSMREVGSPLVISEGGYISLWHDGHYELIETPGRVHPNKGDTPWSLRGF